jgi:hypothetical protein
MLFLKKEIKIFLKERFKGKSIIFPKKGLGSQSSLVSKFSRLNIKRILNLRGQVSLMLKFPRFTSLKFVEIPRLIHDTPQK